MKQILFLILFTAMLVNKVKSQEKMQVYFEYNRDEITAATAARLDSFINTNILAAAIVSIDLSGHCDARGSDELNDRLSGERIKSVKTYFILKGIPADRIKSETAMGKRQPINENSNEEEMALNRRVEIILQKPLPVEVQEKKDPAITITQQLNDTSAPVGRTLILRNLNFHGGRHVLLPGSLPVLEELLSALKNNPSLEISIEGHVCCAQGSIDGLDTDTRTFNLSVNRAKMVHDYLVSNGIDSSRLSWDGYGNKYPIIPYEVTESDRITNRRVEIKVLKK